MLVLLGISVLFNMGHFMRGFVPVNVSRVHAVGPRLEEVITEDNDASSQDRRRRGGWHHHQPGH